jgi:hypothetical protein
VGQGYTILRKVSDIMAAKKRKLTNWQRKVKAHNAAVKRRKSRAIADLYRKINPGKTPPAFVRVKHLKGEVRITPVRGNISDGYVDAGGTFHPIRSSDDYSKKRAGEGPRGREKKSAAKRVAAVRRRARR